MNKENIIIIIFLTVFSIYIGSIPGKDIDLKIASDGYSPIEYVSKELHPENYVRDFPNGIQNYNFSLPMRVYVLLKKRFNIEPLQTIHLHFYIQSIILFIGLYYLLSAIINNTLFSFLSVGVIMLSDFSGTNLARYFSPLGLLSMLYFPLFYGLAAGFGFVALGAILRNRILLGLFFLFLSISSHVVMGGFFLVSFLIIGYPLIKKYINIRNLLYMSFILFLGILFLFYNYYQRVGISTTGKIPDSDWIRAGQVFGCHSFPFTLRVFSSLADEAFIPIIISFIFITFLYLNKIVLDGLDCRIYQIIVVTLLITIIGVFIPFLKNPFLIKLHLHRASSLSSLFLLILTLKSIYVILGYNLSNVYLLLSSMFLTMIIGSKAGFGVLYLCLLGLFLYNDLNHKYKNIVTSSYNIIILLLSVVIISILIYFNFNDVQNIENPILNWILRKETGASYLMMGGFWNYSYTNIFYIFILTMITLKLLQLLNTIEKTNMHKRNLFFGVIFALMLLLFWQLSLKVYKDTKQYHTPDLLFANDFKEAQLWAKQNTSKNSLFLVDPTHFYGWRDFSERSSLGSFREWGYFFFYDSNYSAYSRGRELMKEFLGYDFYQLSDSDIEKKGYECGRFFQDDFRSNFYSIDTKRYIELSKKYNFDYLLLKRKNIVNNLDLNEVFKNDSIVVYKM